MVLKPLTGSLQGSACGAGFGAGLGTGPGTGLGAGLGAGAVPGVMVVMTPPGSVTVTTGVLLCFGSRRLTAAMTAMISTNANMTHQFFLSMICPLRINA